MEGVPSEIQHVLTGALQKEVAKRYSNSKDLLHVLAPGSVSPSSQNLYTKKRPQPVLWVIAVLGVAAVVLASLGLLSDKQEIPVEETPQLVQRQLTFTGNAFKPAISPDGELMAYYVNESDTSGSIYMQEVDGGQPVKVLSNVVQFFTSVVGAL